MWVSEREAIRLLGGVAGGHAQAQAVLRAGLAAPCQRLPGGTRSAVLYAEDAVLRLAARPIADVSSAQGRITVAEACPRGLYLARLSGWQALAAVAATASH